MTERPPSVHRAVDNPRLVLWMPYAPGGQNRAWLRHALGRRVDARYVGRGRWEIARPHLRALVEACVGRFGEVEVILDFRAQDRCDSRCREAVGDDCVCSCLGRNHGGAGYWKGWADLGDATPLDDGQVVRRRLRPRRDQREP